MKHCQKHGPEKHPCCVDCLRDDYEENAATHGHDAAWEKLFIRPLAKIMQDKGIHHMAIVVDNGKATYVLDPVGKSPAPS